MNGLMLHCGGQIKSRDEVFAVPLPTATASYVPLSYESLVTRIEKQLAVEGIRITNQQLALAQNGSGCSVSSGRDASVPHSGLRLRPRVAQFLRQVLFHGLCIGASVFVCDNLSFSGSQITFQRKHTTNLLRDLSWIITETVAKLPVQFAAQSRTFEQYQTAEISDRQVHDLVIRFYDERAVNLTDIPAVLREWREPRHPEFAQGGKPPGACSTQ